MNGEIQQQQVQYEQPVEQASAPKSGILKWIWVMIGIVVLVIIGVVSVIILRRPGQVVQQPTSHADVIEGECADADNPEFCREQRTISLAEKTGDMGICAQLDGEAKDTCFWRQAEQKKDTSLCSNLSTEILKTGCEDSINLVNAEKSKSREACEALLNEDLRQSCIGSYLFQLTTDECQRKNEDPIFCQFHAVVEEAQAKQDPDICSKITSGLAGECRDIIGPGDRDFDGLKDYEEKKYGSDDRNPDTDGDGFSDYDEVKAGYNPAGEGKL